MVLSRKIFEKLGLALILMGTVIVCLGIFQGKYGAKKHVELQKSHKILDSRVTQLKERRDFLALEIKRIKNSEDYATKVIKEKYKIKEPGEVLETYE